MTAGQGAERHARQAIERLHDAMNMLMSGDPIAINALCSYRDDMSAFRGRSGYEKGWEQVSER